MACTRPGRRCGRSIDSSSSRATWTSSHWPATASTSRCRDARHGNDGSEHLNRLFRSPKTSVFCFDGDRAGSAGCAWRALETALPQIREGRQVRFVFLPDGQDPDSLRQRIRRRCVHRGKLDSGMALVRVPDFGELASQVDLESVDGRARLAELARPLVQRRYRRAFTGSCSSRQTRRDGSALPVRNSKRCSADADNRTRASQA